jgi:hypothetical protein
LRAPEAETGVRIAVLVDFGNERFENALPAQLGRQTAVLFVKALRLPFLCAVWLLLVGGGLSAFWRYGNTPGKTDRPSEEWSADSRLQRASSTPSLIMFVHPKCGCSRASFNELSSLLTHSRGNLNAHVVFMEPADKVGEWSDTDLWRMASEIPTVT